MFLDFIKVGWEVGLNLCLCFSLHPCHILLRPFVHCLANTVWYRLVLLLEWHMEDLLGNLVPSPFLGHLLGYLTPDEVFKD